MKKIITTLCIVALLTGGLLFTTTSPANAYSSPCANFKPTTPIVDVVFNPQGYPYVLTANGGVWLACFGIGSSQHRGDASLNVNGSQPYFQGRTAKTLTLCVGSNGTTSAYAITATSGETYYYADYGDSSCWTQPGRHLIGSVTQRQSFTTYAPITQIFPVGDAYYVLLTNGGVWAKDLPWYGDATNGSNNVQPYFQGRTAQFLYLCGHAPVRGYTVVATSGERYSYGNVLNGGCTYYSVNL